MGDGKWNGYEWWFHGQHTDASFNSLSISLSLSLVCDCLNCGCCCCCCIVFAMRFALLIRRFRSLYIFVHSSSGISVVCRNLPRMIFIYSFSGEAANSNWRQEEDNIHFCACLRACWPIADVANDRHPSERGAHCTILQQQWTYVYIHTVHMYSNLGRPFVIFLFFARLHNYYYSSISSLSFFFSIHSGWFCIALLTLKTKWQICKDADAYADSAANAAACRYLLGQLPQSVGNHNKKLILIKRFSCNCCQLRYAPRRIRQRETPSLRRWRWRWRRC